ncbi:carotenoid biosynthesis protein [Portibacter marinus]|uniref:carotenoid biosynthesis protein n=1 Tax=Portibacter marinus TaxID=2898660 RepID=UPI001F30B871|nr:carotenoid biosynthesis protein [Portibacter marinus]
MNRKSWAILVLIVLHVVGIFGILSPVGEYFLILTPLNLLISLGILVSFHHKKTNTFYLSMAIIMLAGYAIEVIGVNTGWPFGNYQYGDPLGPKWLGTPFMIGVNWFILSYCAAIVFRKVTPSALINAILAGLSITAFDMILEPVAIYLDFWTWSSEQVPIQNYITWAVCITAFVYLYYKMQSKASNPLAKWVLAVQLVFFSGLLIGSQL